MNQQQKNAMNWVIAFAIAFIAVGLGAMAIRVFYPKADSRPATPHDAGHLVDNVRYGNDELAEQAGKLLPETPGAIKELVDRYNLGLDEDDPRNQRIIWALRRFFGNDAITYVQDIANHPMDHDWDTGETARKVLAKLQDPPPGTKEKEAGTEPTKTEEKKPDADKPKGENPSGEPTLAPPEVKPEPKEEKVARRKPQGKRTVINNSVEVAELPPTAPAPQPVVVNPPPVDFSPVMGKIDRLATKVEDVDKKVDAHTAAIARMENAMATKADVADVKAEVVAARQDINGIPAKVAELKLTRYWNGCRWITAY